ncbi:hypothetical protein GCM10027416_11380 [Okibacterium endophyticum]
MSWMDAVAAFFMGAGDEGPRELPRLARAERQVELGDSPYVGVLLHDQPDEPDSLNINAGRRAGDLALGGPHTLCVARTGSGKSRAVAAQNILLAGARPVIAMSAKGDLAELTIEKRAEQGPVYLMDLSGRVRESELQGVDVTRVVSDPCALVSDDDSALLVSSLLHQMGTLGAGGSGEISGDSARWTALATPPLAGFLRAGGWLTDPDTGERTWGGGIRWVLAALDVFEREKDEDPEKADAPCWDNAANRIDTCTDSRFAQALQAVQAMAPEQRDSIAINVRNALFPFQLSTVAGDGTEPPFTPELLEERGTTLYLVTPGRGISPGAAAAVLEQTITHWMDHPEKGLRTLTLVLDEMATGARLPTLSEVVNLGRGAGIRIIGFVQSLSQLKLWGEVPGEILKDAWPSILLFPSAAGSKEVLEAAAWTAGEDQRTAASTDSLGRASRSSEKADRFTGADLLAPRRGQARLVTDGTPGVLVRLPDLEQTSLLD